MAVKGTKFVPMRVTPHSPRATWLRFGGLLLAFGISLPASYFAGAYWVEAQHSATANTQDQAHEKVVAALTQELTQLRTGVEVDRQSMEELRQLVMTQKAQLHAAERDLRVYKDLLSPGAKSNPLGISFGVFSVLPLPEAGHFSYSLTVQKLATKEVDFSGFLEFRIIGRQGDKSLQLSLYQVSAQVSAPSIPLNFKYFHTLQGELLLPDGFVPQSVELVVKASDQKTPPLVAAELDWPISAFKPK